MAKLESCSNELHGLAMLGHITYEQSENLSTAGMGVDEVMSDLEDIISGEQGED